jgi:methionyl-tRNA formyltransferase
MKVAFFGTPSFAVPSLRVLLGSKKHEVVCIVCQPDKPVGRGGKIEFGPVKQFGLTHGIDVLQPERISDEVGLLDKYKPDIIVTCAYGQILKQNVLDYVKHGVINVHGSLLPKYRGANPIQWAVINGETKTGVTIMQTDIGMDTGDMILKAETEIGADETAGELFERLSILGAEALLEALDLIEKGKAIRVLQDNSQATHAPKITKEMAKIDFGKTGEEIRNFVRGMNPWPVAWLEHNGEVIRVFKASVGKGDFCLPCKDGFVNLEVIQMSGGKVLPARDYINGRKIRI